MGISNFFSKTAKISKTATLAMSLFFLPSETFSVEILASKGDTFISQAFPDGEFSKSEFLALSRDKNEKTITYIPFELDAQQVGIMPERDIVNSAVLTLFVKSLPSIPKSNALESEGKSDITPDINPNDTDESAKKISENIDDKINSAEENVIKIEVFGVIDEETFEPNSKNYRVSWNGKKDATAPKHNNIDDNLDQTGLFKIGTIEIDVSKNEYEDGDRLELQNDELIEYVSFCYGITAADEKSRKFRSSLSKIRNATILLRQESGPSALFFYSSDSLGEHSDKVESGDEAEPKEGGAKTKDDEKQSETKQSNSTARQVSLSDDEKSGEKKITNAFERAQKKAEDEKVAQKTKKFKKDIVKKYSAGKGDFNFSLSTETIATEERGESENNSDDEKPDYRPRITFEFREKVQELPSE